MYVPSSLVTRVEGLRRPYQSLDTSVRALVTAVAVWALVFGQSTDTELRRGEWITLVLLNIYLSTLPVY